MTDPLTRLLTPTQAAREAGRTPSAILLHIKAGRLPAVMVGRSLLITRRAWERFRSEPLSKGGRPRAHPAPDPDAPKRPRGRPRKAAPEPQGAPDAPRRPKGRPRKSD